MNRTEMLDSTESVLKSAGFLVSKKCVSRPSCFCMAARKDKELAFFDVPSDLGNVTRRDSFELKIISDLFSAAPLFIGDKTRERKLEDDTIYSRYDVYAVTLKTLEDVVSQGMNPLIEAGPGGYFVQLDGEALRNKRQEDGLSVGKLAEQLSISRRTLYGYERSMTKASVAIAYNLENILGVPLVKPINLFKPASSGAGFFSAAKRVMVKSRFLHTVLKRLNQCQFNAAPTLRAPFDFIAHNPENQINILGGIAHRGEKGLNQRAQEIKSVCDIVKAQPVFVTDGNIVLDDMPSIRSEELDGIRHPADLISRM